MGFTHNKGLLNKRIPCMCTAPPLRRTPPWEGWKGDPPGSVGGGGGGRVPGSLGSQKEPRGLGSNLRQFGTGRHGAPSFGLTGAGAGTQCPRRSGTPRSGVGGPGMGLSELRPRPSPGRRLRIGWFSLTSGDPAPARALPRAHPRGRLQPTLACHSPLPAKPDPEPQSRRARRGAPGPRRRAGDAPET